MLNTKNIWFDGINFVSFQGVLTALTCTRAIGNLWSICLGVNVLILEWSETLSEKPGPLIFIGKISPSKASKTLSLSSKKVYKFLRISILL